MDILTLLRRNVHRIHAECATVGSILTVSLRNVIHRIRDEFATVRRVFSPSRVQWLCKPRHPPLEPRFPLFQNQGCCLPSRRKPRAVRLAFRDAAGASAIQRNMLHDQPMTYEEFQRAFRATNSYFWWSSPWVQSPPSSDSST